MLRFIKTINSFIIGYTFKRAQDIVDLELCLFLDDGISHSSLLVSITISSIFIIFLLLRLVNANSHSSTSTTNVQGSTHLFWCLPPHILQLILLIQLIFLSLLLFQKLAYPWNASPSLSRILPCGLSCLFMQPSFLKAGTFF
jgi:hypothetical protein